MCFIWPNAGTCHGRSGVQPCRCRIRGKMDQRHFAPGNTCRALPISLRGRRGAKRMLAPPRTAITTRSTHLLLTQLLVLSSRVLAGPSLTSFDLDMNDGCLALTFDTAVSNDTADIDWTGVSLRTHVNGLEGSGVILWNTEGEQGWGQALLSNLDLTLTVDIHPSDFDEMKYSYVGHNSSFAWITLRRGTFVDLHGANESEPVYGTQVVGHEGLSVSNLVQDSTSPTLEKFTVGLTRRELVMFFSKGVDASTIDATELVLFTNETSYLKSEIVKNASLGCSSAERGQRGSYREVILHLEAACDSNTTAEASAATNGSSLDSIATESSVDYTVNGYLVDSTNNGSSASSSTSSSSSSSTEHASSADYASDWDMLVDLEIIVSAQDATDYSRDSSVFHINATSGFVMDLSSAQNTLDPVENLPESFPDCQPCGNGTFRLEPCTDVYDATCETCTEDCSGGDMYVLSPCTAETDLDCHRCTPCPFGTREVGACEGDSDRTCEACTECEESEYESRACSTGGDDRMCDSCLRCSMSPAVAEACKESPVLLSWQRLNCCETREGENVACIDVPMENLRISAREGHRHWVFEPSIPPVEGYSQDYWGQGAKARDGVTPRDDFIEVAFRPGAKSVFDDPRYLGQEGPSLGADVA